MDSFIRDELEVHKMFPMCERFTCALFSIQMTKTIIEVHSSGQTLFGVDWLL